MKKALLILNILLTGAVYAQKPETVYSIVKECREISWYETQQKLWKEETDKNKTNATAWYNYYSATRALKNLVPGSAKTDKEAADSRIKYQEQCNQIVDEALKQVPNSFEANHLKFWNGNLVDEVPYLLKAYEINPLDVRAYDDLMIHYEVERNQAEFEKFATKLFECNDMPSGILNWGYNVLSELDDHAILFTAGDNDTYATWIVQAAKKFRPDVKVINTSLFGMDEYRNKLYRELGLEPLPIAFQTAKTDKEYVENQKKILDHVFQSKKPVYVATTAISQFEESWGGKLYLTGLAYKYSEKPIDNISLIKRNYEKRYLLDHLKEQFSFNIGDQNSESFNGTYIPSMLKLYQHYRESEDMLKTQELETLIISISEKTGQQSEIFEALEKPETGFILLSTLLDVNGLEKNMLPLKGKLYLDKYEVTNNDYRKFLDNLLRSDQKSMYDAVIYDSTEWVDKFPYASNDPMQNMYHWHPGFDDYPVVNVSYEGAKAYCDWLTKQYNMQRKRKYTQVLFRLPTESEWKFAAGSGNENAQTCFPNDQIQNEKKEYLCNIQPEPGRFFPDGGFHTSKVDSYKANPFGLYCMFGNVSEMIAEKGIAKGGSWYNLPEECYFQKEIRYDKADPGIGFRVLMEVIEE